MISWQLCEADRDLPINEELEQADANRLGRLDDSVTRARYDG